MSCKGSKIRKDRRRKVALANLVKGKSSKKEYTEGQIAILKERLGIK